MKKKSNSWYNNKNWNGDIDSYFEKQLRYTRNPMHKAAYLQVQGCLLLEHKEERIQDVGLVLLGRLFDDHPTAHSAIHTAEEKLGDYHFKKGNLAKAAYYFKKVTDYCMEQHSRTGTSAMADLKWAATVLHGNLVTEMPAAYDTVVKYPTNLLKTPADQFFYAELAALICHRLYKVTEAEQYAGEALKISEKMKPLGKDKATEADFAVRLQKLSLIKNGGSETI
jgi:hypothetical protein